MLYGADEIRFPKFGGGLVLDVDPSEIGEDQATAAENVDFDEEVLAKRKGRVVYNATANVASKVRALHRVYPRDGGAGRFLTQVGTVIEECDGAGTFASGSGAGATGLTGGAPGDFVGWKELVYFGNGIDAVRKRATTPAWTVVALLTPPVAPTLALSQTVLETFDSNTGGSAWTLVGSNLTRANETSIQREGASALSLTPTNNNARGAYIHRAFSSGATVDLSTAKYLSLWYYSERVGMVFRVAVKDNSGALDFSLFPIFTATSKDTWKRILVPLDKIPPANRTASTGLAIQFVERPNKVDLSTASNVSLLFDEARAQGPLLADHYSYQATYAELVTREAQLIPVRESNPSAVASIDVPDTDAALGISVTVTGVADTTNNTHIRIYRRRRDGVFSRAKLVKEIANPGATTTSFVDVLGDDEISLNDYPDLVSSKIAPPLARTYCACKGRSFAGHVYADTSSSPDSADTWFPWRLYMSRFGYPEEFGGDEAPLDPNAPGWLDIANRDHIRRLVEFDGGLLVFCDRAIYTLEGSNWDDFAFRKRADVGLDAREAVVVTDRLIYFLASDGVRILAPNRSQDGLFDTWVISEPVDSLLRAIPYTYRPDACMGQDERGRILLSITAAGGTANSIGLVFDPTQTGAIAPDAQPRRRGWTVYSNWGFSCFVTLKRGGGDAGQLVGGDVVRSRVHYLHRSTVDAALEHDGTSTLAEDIDTSETIWTVADGTRFAVGQVLLADSERVLVTGISGNDLTVTRGYQGTTAAAHTQSPTTTVTALISWSWRGKTGDAGPGRTIEWVYVSAQLDAAANQSVTATPILDNVASATTYTLSLGAGSSGFVNPLQRTGANIRGRFAALQLSGAHAVPLKVRSLVLGHYLR